MPDGTRAAPTRRHALRALFALGVVASTSAALLPVLRAGRRAAAPAAVAAAAASGAGKAGTVVEAGTAGMSGTAGTGGTVDEIYQGRHIRIGAAQSLYTPPGAGFLAAPPRSPHAPAALPDIRIDGRPLQLMRRADGGYLSVVNHYESFPTPLDAARAAVDDLAGAELSLSGPIHHI